MAPTHNLLNHINGIKEGEIDKTVNAGNKIERPTNTVSNTGILRLKHRLIPATESV